VLASAMAASLAGLRSRSLPSQVVGFARHTMEVAPRNSIRRIDWSPALVIAPRRSFPPLEFCRGTMPSHAAKFRPRLNLEGSPILATINVAASGPTDGMVARLRLSSQLL